MIEAEMIKVIVNGANGKMGQLACAAIDNTTDLTLVAALTRHEDLKASIQQTAADVVVDLTEAAAVFANTTTILTTRAKPVIGTSGLTPDQIQTLQQQAADNQTAGIIVPNFSIGMVKLIQFASQLAQHYTTAEIIEAHHTQKKDKPSGTAAKTAHSIRTTWQAQQLSKTVPIHSLRLPGVVAQQQTIFSAPGETITLCHETIDRQSFMPGLLLACRGVTQLNGLYYGLEKLLDPHYD